MTYQELKKRLQQRYSDGEATAVARYLVEMKYGLSMADVACGGVDSLDEATLANDVECTLGVRSFLILPSASL